MCPVCSVYRDEVIEEMPEMPPCMELDGPPTEEELESALSKLKRRKAGGQSGILPELVLYGGAVLWDRLLDLIKDVWEEGKVVEDWRNAVVVSIPKKSSLLDVVGKIMASIVQERLIAESILLDFRSEGAWSCWTFRVG